ncbi:MAG: ABC transporter substrate binding protein [Sedimenticola sp.]
MLLIQMRGKPTDVINHRRYPVCFRWISVRATHRLVVLLLLLSLSSASAMARSIVDVLVVSSAESSVYQSVVSSLRSHLAESCNISDINCTLPKIREATLNNWAEQIDGMDPNSVILTLGRSAAKQVKIRSENPPHVVNALIPKAAADQLSLDSTAHRNTTIYLDQPIRRQLRLTAIAKPNARVGVLLGPTTQELRPRIEQEAAKLGLLVNYRNIMKEEMIGPSLKNLLNNSDILLALPDQVIYSRKNLFNILLSSYHSKVPVIGFSSAYVKAGAIAAVYSSPEDIGRHLADIFGTMLREEINGSHPAHHHEYPKYFSVDINKSVSKSLHSHLPSRKEIMSILSNKGERE